MKIIVQRWLGSFLVLCAGFVLVGCDLITEALKKSDNKRIEINDTAPGHGFAIKNIAQTDYVLLALLKDKPNVSNLDVSGMLGGTVAIGKRGASSKINLPLYEGFLDYWTGDGSFWVVFVQLNKEATHASYAVSSKERINFYDTTTYLRNIDFMLPIKIDIELGNLLKDKAESL